MGDSSLRVFLLGSRSLKCCNQLLGFGLEVTYVFLLIFTLLPDSRPFHLTIGHFFSPSLMFKPKRHYTLLHNQYVHDRPVLLQFILSSGFSWQIVSRLSQSLFFERLASLYRRPKPIHRSAQRDARSLILDECGANRSPIVPQASKSI
jgi:hypothetical protein